MLNLHDVETFIQHKPAHLQEIVLELRNLIAQAAPDAVEVIRCDGLGYFHEGRGGIVSAGIALIGLREDHVELAFIHGAFLPDPRHLLVGKEKAKRHLRIESFEAAPWEDLKELITASSKFDPRMLAHGTEKR